MAKARVFISFDFDNDLSLKNLLVGQSRYDDSPFEISDWSLKEAAPESNWEKEAEAKIKRANILCVIAGKKTYNASGVLKEIKITDSLIKQNYSIKKFELIGHPDVICPHVDGAGTRIAWTWPNLKKYLEV